MVNIPNYPPSYAPGGITINAGAVYMNPDAGSRPMGQGPGGGFGAPWPPPRFSNPGMPALPPDMWAPPGMMYPPMPGYAVPGMPPYGVAEPVPGRDYNGGRDPRYMHPPPPSGSRMDPRIPSGPTSGRDPIYYNNPPREYELAPSHPQTQRQSRPQESRSYADAATTQNPQQSSGWPSLDESAAPSTQRSSHEQNDPRRSGNRPQSHYPGTQSLPQGLPKNTGDPSNLMPSPALTDTFIEGDSLTRDVARPAQPVSGGGSSKPKVPSKPKHDIEASESQEMLSSTTSQSTRRKER